MAGLVQYLKESQEELRKVTWPTRRQVSQLTALVIGISLVVAALIGAFDWLLAFAYQKLLTL